ncbi:ATP-binding cassette domain-containing protein [Subdoligranulum variabile]|uniref:ABC transporter, ATP-binding protein n=1 Tax=Subdoligranulum variabile DSM 15176 TaxID=411471 RepID=D1PMU9_9FIRM|nr:ABC transporter ATP-binding protein [Subdoligranulum variabile]EFB75884.1 ABC transporter, ATP-binding protein [Subdoligranulum variabile DSM 15176]UWP68551.1 ABC transporter ATP-binding protein [Subdoligranulum variabile]
MNETGIYEARGLCKRYGRKMALNGVTFSVQPGKLVGLLGPNGSGKTTLLKISAGLLTANGGMVLIDGNEPGICTKRVTSYLPDRMALATEMRAADAVSLYADFYADFDAVKAHAMLADLHIEAQDRIGAMSKGTQEKMQLCLTMSRAAKLYLLDEPLGGVDPAAREYILHTILRNYSEDAALVLSTHLIGDIEKALDEVIFLKEGTVLQQVGVDALREETGRSVDEYFREVYKC